MNMHKLWDIDPGYFRLKHAFKTILAILIALWLMRGESIFVKGMVGLACGFSMQGVVAKSSTSRLKQIVLFDLTYFIVFILGLLVRDSAIGTSLVLVMMGFVANYVRRFGLQTSVAPMMAWTLCFFATILPFNSTAEIWMHIYALILALFISAMVNIFVLPENYPRLFVWNSNRIFRSLAQGMHELRQYVTGQSKEQAFEKYGFVRIKNTLTYLLESNQAIEQSDEFSQQSNQISDLLLEQYALVHSYAMMVDAYHLLCRHNQQLLQPAQDELVLIHQQFEMLFASMIMDQKYAVVSSASIVFLPPLVKSLGRSPTAEPAIIISLLNLKLSFNLLNRHAKKLLRIADET